MTVTPKQSEKRIYEASEDENQDENQDEMKTRNRYQACMIEFIEKLFQLVNSKLGMVGNFMLM